MECYTCIHYEDASRYDPSEPNELYTLMKCNLHGHVTDWPWPCDDYTEWLMCKCGEEMETEGVCPSCGRMVME